MDTIMRCPLRKTTSNRQHLNLVSFCLGAISTVFICALYIGFVNDSEIEMQKHYGQQQPDEAAKGRNILTQYSLFTTTHRSRTMSKGLQSADANTKGLQSADTNTKGLQSADANTKGLQSADANTNLVVNSKLYPSRNSNVVKNMTLGSPTSNLPSITKPLTSSASCLNSQQRNIVCIKVHKAASTTAVAIVERYGYKHNLTLAVRAAVKFGPHILSSSGKFKRGMVYQWQRGYNLLTNHVRYNRAEMDAVVPNATYITIIRHPVKHFESAFVYFLVAKHLNIHERPDPMAAFFDNPEEHIRKKFYFWFQLQSGQIFDLGLDHADHTGPKVAAQIQHLASHFDLVMLADYFDESLLLLRKHLCLEWRDILYIPDNFRVAKQKMVISDEVRKQIQMWNWADMTLYQHFYHTFWDRVKDYGPGFADDLQHFRRLLTNTRENCTTGNIKRKAHDAHGVRTLEIRKNASEFCRSLLLGDVDYTRLFRERQETNLYNLPKHWER